MKAEDVVIFYKLFEDNRIKIWIDGGWAVDALLGKQTREHEDLDIVVQTKDLTKLRRILEKIGFKNVPRDDTSDWNFVLGDHNGRLIDIHAIRFDEKGNGLYGPTGWFYHKESLTGGGEIKREKVKCISAKYLVEFHANYEPKEKDFKDVSALCEKFSLELPQQYKNFTKK